MQPSKFRYLSFVALTGAIATLGAACGSAPESPIGSISLAIQPTPADGEIDDAESHEDDDSDENADIAELQTALREALEDDFDDEPSLPPVYYTGQSIHLKFTCPWGSRSEIVATPIVAPDTSALVSSDYMRSQKMTKQFRSLVGMTRIYRWSTLLPGPYKLTSICTTWNNEVRQSSTTLNILPRGDRTTMLEIAAANRLVVARAIASPSEGRTISEGETIQLDGSCTGRRYMRAAWAIESAYREGSELLSNPGEDVLTVRGLRGAVGPLQSGDYVARFRCMARFGVGQDEVISFFRVRNTEVRLESIGEEIDETEFDVTTRESFRQEVPTLPDRPLEWAEPAAMLDIPLPTEPMVDIFLPGQVMTERSDATPPSDSTMVVRRSLAPPALDWSAVALPNQHAPLRLLNLRGAMQADAKDKKHWYDDN